MLRTVCDQGIVQRHQSSRPEDQTPSKFEERWGDAMDLVVDRATRAVVPAANSWAECVDGLEVLTRTGIGMHLYGAGLKSVARELVEKILKRKVDA